MALSGERHADGLVPKPVDRAFQRVFLVEQVRPFGQVLVAGKDDASGLLGADPVDQLEEQQGLVVVEPAVSDLVDDEAGMLGKPVQQPARRPTDQGLVELVLQLVHLDEVRLDLVAAALVPDGHGEVRLAGSRRPDHDHVPLRADEGEALQRTDLPLRMLVQQIHVEVPERERRLLGDPGQPLQRADGRLVLLPDHCGKEGAQGIQFLGRQARVCHPAEHVFPSERKTELGGLLAILVEEFFGSHWAPPSRRENRSNRFVAASGGSERMSVVTFSVGCSSGSADHWPAQAFGFLLQSTRWVQTSSLVSALRTLSVSPVLITRTVLPE